MNAKLIIADPPWYEAEMKAFLAVAQAIAETGAEILMSIPPINIRPGIEAERSRIFNWATHGGLDLLSITPCGTRYFLPRLSKMHCVYRVLSWPTTGGSGLGEVPSLPSRRIAYYFIQQGI